MRQRAKTGRIREQERLCKVAQLAARLTKIMHARIPVHKVISHFQTIP